MTDFQPLEFVGHGSETQIQMGEKLINKFSKIKVKALNFFVYIPWRLEVFTI